MRNRYTNEFKAKVVFEWIPGSYWKRSREPLSAGNHRLSTATRVGRFFFIQSVLDIYDRSVIDYHIGLFCTAKDAVASLKGALLRRQLYGRESRPVVRSDNGPQFVSGIFEEACQQLGLDHERIPYKIPNMNASSGGQPAIISYGGLTERLWS